MNLVLRPLNDINDVTWSIIISILILLAGVAYYIYTIMKLAYSELVRRCRTKYELKDAEQDQEIALLKHRVEQLENEGPTADQEMVKELRERVRKLERTVGVLLLLFLRQLP